MAITLDTTSDSVSGASSSTNFPASILDRSSTVLTICIRWSAEASSLSMRRDCSGSSPAWRIRWAMPIIALSGVRISWLMLAR